MSTKKKSAAKKPAPKPVKVVGGPSAGAAIQPAPSAVGYGVRGKKDGAALAPLPVSSIQVVEGFNPRTHLGSADELATLAGSIAASGLLQPLLVYPSDKPGIYWLIDGERRLKCAKSLKMTTVPVCIRTDIRDAKDALTLCLTTASDDSRKALTDIELGGGFMRLRKEGMSPAEISRRTGCGHMTVRRTLDLMEAPEDIRKRVDDGKLSAAAALELSGLDPATRRAVENDIEDNMSASKIRAMAKAAARTKSAPSPGKSPQGQKGAARDAARAAWRPCNEKQEMIANTCYAIIHPTPEDDTNRMVGILGALLWDRDGIDDIELTYAKLTNGKLTEEPPAGMSDLEKKKYKSLLALICAESKKFQPPVADKK